MISAEMLREHSVPSAEELLERLNEPLIEIAKKGGRSATLPLEGATGFEEDVWRSCDMSYNAPRLAIMRFESCRRLLTSAGYAHSIVDGVFTISW